MENKIDLLTSIAYTKQRDLQMDFSKEIVCTLWGTVYANPNLKLIPYLIWMEKNRYYEKRDFREKV